MRCRATCCAARVPALEEEAQPHEVPGETGGDDAGAEVVPDLRSPADERLLPVDAPPLAGEQPEPHVVRVPAQRLAHDVEPARVVVKDRAAGQLQEDLLRRAEPARERDALLRVEPESLLQPAPERADLDLVRDGHVVPAEARRPAVKLVRQAVLDGRPDRRRVLGVDEDLQARTPAVVRRARRVEAEDVRSGAEQRGRVRHVADEGRDHFLVEGA